jgi:iron complex outermembrane receptor protein
MFCRNTRFFDTLAALLAVLPAARVAAQNVNPPSQLAPVTVTGAAITAIPQSSVSAATVVSGQEVQVGEITSARDLTAQTPNLSVFDANDQRTPRFSFRGFRENNFGAGEPVVGVYVDGIPYYDLYSRGLALYDAREIQFIRGDQGTLYGASGVGGVINVLTRQPENQTHGYAQASYGDYNAQNYQLGGGGAIVTNKLFFGVAGLDASRIGFVYNNVNHDHPDSQDTLALRGVLRWTPSDPWNVTLVAGAGRDNDGMVATYLPGADASPFDVSRRLNGDVHTDYIDEALKIGYEAGPVRVTSVMTHRNWQQNLLQDFDFNALPFQVNGFSNPQLDQWTEELRVESTDAAAAFKWRAGLYYVNADLRNDSGSVDFLPPIEGGTTSIPTLSDSQNDTYALFGQGTYTLWQKLDLTAGVRLTYDYRQMQRTHELGGYNFYANLSDEFTSAQPKFAAAWHFTPTLEAYASVTEGCQSGGFNPGIDTPSLSRFSPERDWQFEAGGKSSWLNDKLSANAALFYTVAGNYQTYQIATNGVDAYMLNAHRADLYGAELELTAKPLKGLDVSAGAGYTEARYSRFTEPAQVNPFGTGALDLDGKGISFVPEFTANASARYRLPWWHLYLHGEVIGVGRYHLDDSYTAAGQTAQSAYALVNAQFGYQSRSFDVYLFARNIFDKRYYNNALNLGPSYGGSLVLQAGDPLTYGIAATARF